MPYPRGFGRRAFPCSPGGKFLFSMAHLSVRQRWPFKKSFCPSRRHSRHTASQYLAKQPSSDFSTGSEAAATLQEFSSRRCLLVLQPLRLNSTALRRTATVMRNRGNVLQVPDFQPCGRERADRRFTSRPGALHADFHGPHAVVTSGTRHP